MDDYLRLDEHVILCNGLRGLLVSGDDDSGIADLKDIRSGLFDHGFILMDNNHLISRGSST